MRTLATTALAAALIAAASAAVLAQPAPQPPAQDSEQIVVTGERLHDILRDFVGEISAPAGENQIARWDHRICTGVFGMTHREQAQFIADRLAQRAFAAGLEAGGPGCRANIVIFVTPDAGSLSRALVADYGALLAARPADYNVHNNGQAALEGFANSTRPVRWWHVAETVSADGFRLNPADSHAAFDGEGEMSMGARVRVFDPSRLRRATRQDFSRVIIVVDARQASGKRLDALADYLAMVSLAQLSPDIETAAYPSVLNLFSDREAVTGMTQWDAAYLDGLYHATRQARSAHQQQGEIADRMSARLDREAPR